MLLSVQSAKALRLFLLKERICDILEAVILFRSLL